MLNNSISLYDLMERLSEIADEYGDDILVVSSSDYGDISHTEQVVEIQSVEVLKPVKDAYSQSGYAVPKERYRDEYPDDQKGPEVVVLRF